MNKIIKNNIYFKLKQKNKYCCGCTSCINKCIHDAITMKIDKKGFLYASIEDSKCINCGLCIQVCPEINIKNNNVKNPIKYAFKASEDIVKKSSSGGAFTILALHILNNNGVVVGAAYTNNFDVNHIIIDSIDDLYKLRLSKYIQSNQLDCYKKVNKILKEGKKILYSGTPCQIAGLKNFIGGGRKIYILLICFVMVFLHINYYMNI